jgi:hypothetical protein
VFARRARGPNCEEAVVAFFESANNAPYNSPQNCPTDPVKLGWKLTNSYPKPEPSRCPSHTPSDLKEIFLEAAEAFKRGLPNASGTMSRKVLDVSTQQLCDTTFGEDAKKYTKTFGRIEALAAKHVLTPALKDWAHQLRLGGNDASHDSESFTPSEAEELLNFAELYLTYVYTLPGRLEERRKRAEKEKAA